MNLESALKSVLSNSVDMFLQTQIFHWNVIGPMFKSYHDLFGDIYEEVYKSVDETAEHMRSSGFLAPASAMEILKMSMSGGATSVQSQKPSDMVATLVKMNQIVLSALDVAFKAAQKRKAEGLVDFLSGRIAAHKKHEWMLQSSIKEEHMNQTSQDHLIELSADLLARYKTAASNKAKEHDKSASDALAKGDTKMARNHFAKADKRFSGMVKATKKQFKENFSIDRVLDEKVQFVARPALGNSRDVTDYDVVRDGKRCGSLIKKDGGEWVYLKSTSRAPEYRGKIKSVVDSILKEEHESIDELSKQVTGSYIKKATDDVHSKMEQPYNKYKSMIQKIKQRNQNIKKAFGKLHSNNK